jgi:O-antigen ligase
MELRAVVRETYARSELWASNWKEARFRADIGRRLLYVLVGFLPLHAGLVAVGVPSLWKEVIVGATLLIALTLPARAQTGRLDLLFVVYFALVIASAAVHSVTNIADLAPYFLYVPLGFALPRLLTTSQHIGTILWIATGSLLLNAAWMVAVRLGLIAWPDLSALLGPTWNTKGSLTASGLATGTLFGVSAGVAWVAGAVSRHRVRSWLLALVFTAAGGMTGSRAALVLAGVGVFITALLTVAQMRSRPVARAMLAGAVVCMLVAAIVVGPHFLRADDSVRAGRWQATLQLALDNPLLGAGPGAVSQARATRDLGLNPLAPEDNVVGTRVSESSVLKLAAEIGFPGLLVIAVWVVTVLLRAGALRPAHLNGSRYEFVGPVMVLLTAVDGLISTNMESFVGATLFWIGVGLCRSKVDGQDRVPHSQFEEWSIRQAALAWNAMLRSLTRQGRTGTRSV